MNVHLFGNLSGLFVSIAVLIGVVFLAFLWRGRVRPESRVLAGLVLVLMAVLALAAVVLRASILVTGS